MLQENSYVVYDDTLEAVVIDCGAFYDGERKAIPQFIRSQGLTLRHVLCTHGHLDHCFGNDTLYAEFGLKPEVHSADDFLMHDLSQQAADFFGMPYDHPTPPIGHFLTDGELIIFGNHSFRAVHTPGHTPGGITFYCAEEAIAFSGDTLFRMSVGRTDFEGSSWTDMLVSLRRLAKELPPETVIYPGHGPQTTMRDELAMNPYIKTPQ
jgi:glyoxylase-like metal-dependent hydrolase (beta-lactamase superfamily II)